MALGRHTAKTASPHCLQTAQYIFYNKRPMHIVLAVKTAILFDSCAFLCNVAVHTHTFNLGIRNMK